MRQGYYASGCHDSDYNPAVRLSRAEEARYLDAVEEQRGDDRAVGLVRYNLYSPVDE